MKSTFNNKFIKNKSYELKQEVELELSNEDEYIEKAMNSFRLKVINTKENLLEFKINFDKM